VVKELGFVLKEDPQHAGDGEDHLVVQHIQKKCLPHPLASIILQPSQLLLGILDFGEAGVGVFPARKVPGQGFWGLLAPLG